MASNLVPGDTNGVEDVFVHDRATGTTSRVSVGDRGQQADGPSYSAAISADGSAVAFQTQAANLVRGKGRDTNAAEDVYVRDLPTGRTTRVSLTPQGRQFAGPSATPAISGDGRRIAFAADPTGTNQFQVWLADRTTGERLLVSGADGGPEHSAVGRPSISADGRHVAFDSERPRPGEDSSVPARDVWVRDTATGVLSRVCDPAGGGNPDGDSTGPSLSADGRWIAFASGAGNLVAGDVNGVTDVFLRDMLTGTMQLVSAPDSGGPADWHSAYFKELSVSADGRSVVFESAATNLVPGDTNGRSDVFVWDAAGQG